MIDLPAVEIEPPHHARASIVWLHGLGADGHDFEPIVPDLDLNAVRFVFPHAPRRTVTVNGGYLMPAWYDITHPDLEREVDHVGIEDSVRQVQSLLAREQARGIEAKHIVLAGFSQGGVIALHAALGMREPLGGVIALSTYLPLIETLPEQEFALPIFMAHGTQDPIVPLSAAQRARAVLTARGHALDWHQYAIGHSVCAEEIDALRRWLTRRLTGSD